MTRRKYWIIHSRLRDSILEGPFLSHEYALQVLTKIRGKYPNSDWRIEERVSVSTEKKQGSKKADEEWAKFG